MFKLFTQIFGSKYERDVKAYSPIVETTNEFVAEYQSLTHDELRQKTNELKDKIKAHLRDIDEK
jgi:preprotein translocase subunit SecA